MNRRDLETLLLTLESTPVLLDRAARRIAPCQTNQRPAVGGFSLVENVWHMADLEREGYGSRIRRILAENEPVLSNFDGNRIAREREYQRRDLGEGLRAFAEARRRNVEKLRALSATEWDRGGIQESFGPITLADLPRMMAEHDQSHTLDIGQLLDEIRTGEVDRTPRPESAVA